MNHCHGDVPAGWVKISINIKLAENSISGEILCIYHAGAQGVESSRKGYGHLMKQKFRSVEIDSWQVSDAYLDVGGEGVHSNVICLSHARYNS